MMVGVCAIYKHFPGFELSLLPNRVRERKPFGGCPQKELFMEEHTVIPSNLNEFDQSEQKYTLKNKRQKRTMKIVCYIQ
jgi:hypothetical protein